GRRLTMASLDVGRIVSARKGRGLAAGNFEFLVESTPLLALHQPAHAFGLMQRQKWRDFHQKLEIAGGETTSLSCADDAAHVERRHRKTTVGMRAQPPNRQRRAENGANLNVAFFEPKRAGLQSRVIALREGRRRG